MPARPATILGWTLVGLSTLGWAALLAIPFLPLDGGAKAGLAGGMVLAAEVLFWLGAVALGPEAARRLQRWRKRKAGEDEKDAKMS